MPENIRHHLLAGDETHQHPNVAVHHDFACGARGQPTNGRVLASLKREVDGAIINFCYCSCPKREPTVIVERGGNVVAQIPEAREFEPDEKWPQDLSRLFEEASKSYAAGAYTASAMASRKLLMACACTEGADEGKSFVEYVGFITDKVLTFSKAKEAIDKIRAIGNEANHKIRFVTRDEARRALSIVDYMLKAVYSLPSA